MPRTYKRFKRQESFNAEMPCRKLGRGRFGGIHSTDKASMQNAQRASGCKQDRYVRRGGSTRIRWRTGCWPDRE